MNATINKTKPTVNIVGRRWAYAPVIATSFLVAATPTLATIDNQATASGTYNASTVTSPNSALIQIPVAASNPKLSIAKSVLTPATVASGSNATITDAGDKITYQYIVTNNGNITISAVTPVDAGPKFGPSQVAGTGSMSAFTLTAGTTTLAPGQSATFTAQYTLSQLDVDRAAGISVPANAVNNSSTATGTPAIGTLGVVPPGTATTTIPAGPLLAITKTGTLNDVVATGNTAGVADLGETITYTYTVQNTGNVPITAVKINDTHEGALLPAGTVTNEVLVTDGPLAPGVVSSDAAVNGSWDTLQPGATIRFTYTHTVTQTEINGG
jgi:uncharacterized repeat protein (TIGR01451 family)